MASLRKGFLVILLLFLLVMVISYLTTETVGPTLPSLVSRFIQVSMYIPVISCLHIVLITKFELFELDYLITSVFSALT